jgi:MFS family permease
MASRQETNVVYAAGMAQGIVLVTLPAASAVFTDPDKYDLSNTQYGALFLPQVITAISAALLGAGLGGRFGVKRVYLAGLAAGLFSMGLLIVSAFVDWLIGDGTSRTPLFIGYLIGPGIMMIGGIVEILLGINAEGKSIESITKPLTSTDQSDEAVPLPEPA